MLHLRTLLILDTLLRRWNVHYSVEYIFLHYRRSNKWSIHPSTIHQVVLPKKNASLPPTIDSAETPGPASWWNHSTPLAAWKPFKASCTPSSFSPGNNGDFTGNNDLTWFNQQNCAMSQHNLGFQLAKNEHTWGPEAWDVDSNTKNKQDSEWLDDVPIPGDFPFPCSITNRDQNCRYTFCGWCSHSIWWLHWGFSK